MRGPAAVPSPTIMPDGFLWGTATAAHQVEGGNRHSDWWEYEQQGRLPFRSGEACGHYARYAEDFDLARALGQNAHRFSIEWSRLEPADGVWDDAALAHYTDVVAALRARNLEPVVTLHHFTNPAWFLHGGGWTRADAPARFVRYVDRVAAVLAPSVRWWLTINEPTVYAMEGYVLGEWPPCRPRAWRAAVGVVRRMAAAHAAAYAVLHRHRTDARVGFAHSAPLVLPCRPDRLGDRLAAAVRDAVLNRAFFRLVGAAPGPRPRRGAMDFVGVNYYTRHAVRAEGLGLGRLVGRVCRAPHHGGDGTRSDIGWEVYPEGLAAVAARYARYGLPVLITENGIATADDALRVEFLRGHLAALDRAVAAGVPVAGYFHWSLIDNFEWTHGTGARFGLVSVDGETQARTPKASADVYAGACRRGRPGT